ncbi:DUF3105 domain-containing protein [Saccharopolyspora gloriosae]|uniref:DUF3105 domain-containing protein n=1 Tax=Saccharopolyspora gloriosae TaxID=455344 RepID=A0A840NQR9_9PSEU|nr:DUF3105 domain-containing protein [Saccharopolyspora gloriosae]MBB5071609.1 hypothetical protein [Saccharopolyspora gloriosae]
MASGKKNKAMRKARGSVVQQRSIPWMTLSGVGVVLLVAVVVFGYAYVRYADQAESREAQAKAEAAAAPFKPTPQNPDPSKNIPGVETADYAGQQHVTSTQRVAYDKTPPFGGPHDGIWADCTGVVYPQAVRTENMVHSLEHGAVWIAYDPAKVDEAGRAKLSQRVENKPYTMMSPYPELDSPISVQSWGHQVKLDSPDDPRIDQFIAALKQNPNNVYPEVGGSCQAYPGAFDTQNPPPFDPTPPPADAIPMSGEGTQSAPGEMGGQ